MTPGVGDPSRPAPGPSRRTLVTQRALGMQRLPTSPSGQPGPQPAARSLASSPRRPPEGAREHPAGGASHSSPPGSPHRPPETPANPETMRGLSSPAPRTVSTEDRPFLVLSVTEPDTRSLPED